MAWCDAVVRFDCRRDGKARCVQLSIGGDEASSSETRFDSRQQVVDSTRLALRSNQQNVSIPDHSDTSVETKTESVSAQLQKKGQKPRRNPPADAPFKILCQLQHSQSISVGMIHK